jgi:uncharacterized protein YciI
MELLWKLRCRGPRSVESKIIAAGDIKEAEEVARAYIRAHGDSLKYVHIDGPLIVAGPEILEPGGIARDQDFPDPGGE